MRVLFFISHLLTHSVTYLFKKYLLDVYCILSASLDTKDTLISKIDEKPNLTDYEINRKLLLETLTSYGYECAAPDGAFYLFLKAPNGDGNAFSEKAKEKNILVVSGESFGCKEYVRISYCVSTEMIKRALPHFKELI